MFYSVFSTWLLLEIASSHKEFRFVHFSFPFFTFCAAPVLAKLSKKVHNLIAGVNIAVAILFSFSHQRGPVDLMRHLRTEFCLQNIRGRFYGPCHVLPGEYSRFCLNGHHLNISQLTCDPPLSGNLKIPETDLFYKNPADFISKDIQDNDPDTVIFFDKFDENFGIILQENGFQFHDKVFHSYFPLDDQSKFIMIYRR